MSAHARAVKLADSLFDWLGDRADSARDRVMLRELAANTYRPCPGESCPCANEDETPLWRVVLRLNPRDPANDPCDVFCDALDDDVRWRLWSRAYYGWWNMSVKLGVNA